MGGALGTIISVQKITTDMEGCYLRQLRSGAGRGAQTWEAGQSSLKILCVCLCVCVACERTYAYMFLRVCVCVHMCDVIHDHGGPEAMLGIPQPLSTSCIREDLLWKPELTYSPGLAS